MKSELASSRVYLRDEKRQDDHSSQLHVNEEEDRVALGVIRLRLNIYAHCTRRDTHDVDPPLQTHDLE